MYEAGLVTIVMPNRDHARHLPRALDAMVAQTWPQLEIIVVDDASTDDSLDVIADYARRDARVRDISLKEHHGISRAVNVALAAAHGEYIHIAGADDFVAPNFLSHSVAEMNRNTGAGLCFSDPTEYHEEGQQTTLFPLYLSKGPVCYTPAELVELFRYNYFHISANTVVYRTPAFREAGGYLPDLHWLSDWFVTLVVALRYGACYLPEQLTYATVRQDSYSALNLRDRNAQHLLLDRILGLLALPEYADVASQLRRAGLIPEYYFRTLLWLAQHPEGRKFICPRLVMRIVGRSIWSCIRPIAPVRSRRRIRKIRSGSTRVA